MQGRRGQCWVSNPAYSPFDSFYESFSDIRCAIIGLAIRLAQALGIHCTPDPNNISNTKKREEAIIKSSIWYELLSSNCSWTYD
jgi:hypothetical protein